LTRFTSSIGSIDTGKLQAIRTLTSNVVLMSLMDPNQFDRMMEKLEENSAIFGTLLSDSDRGVKRTGGRGSGPGSVGDGGGESAKLSTVKAVSTSTKPDTSMADQLKIMKQMVEIMADISDVVGSKGKLKEYLEEKAGSSGKFDWTSYGSETDGRF
jgi:hypothetical protein